MASRSKDDPKNSEHDGASPGKIFIGGLPKDTSMVAHEAFGFIIFDSEKVVDDLLSKGNMIDLAGSQVEIKKAELKKSSNPPPPPYGSESRVTGGEAWAPGLVVVAMVVALMSLEKWICRFGGRLGGVIEGDMAVVALVDMASMRALVVMVAQVMVVVRDSGSGAGCGSGGGFLWWGSYGAGAGPTGRYHLYAR
ncbi:hypothetical protein HPP92_020039 [Vanilla planifolia]|uniref:Uncharacterized protein n=1 Tax=Vanilla planifolia TaxID=51239 RepID=A0A835Q403_VANPL|nr:hypothetical protein HPP92_020039 [Vanilla planifolia]